MDRWDAEDDLEDVLNGNSALENQGKDLLIFLIDISTSEGASLALKCAHSTLKNLIWKSAMDLFGLVLFGLKEDGDVKFTGSKVLLPLQSSEPESILELESLIDEGLNFSKGPIQLNNALWQCQSAFDEVSGKVGSKRILIFTENKSPLNSEAERKRLFKKAEDLNNTRVSLELIPLSSGLDMKAFWSDFLLRANNEASSEDLCLTSPEDLLRIVRRKIHRKRKLGSIHLDFGAGLKPKVSFYNFIGRSTKPPRVFLTRDTNKEVSLNRIYINPETGGPLDLSMDVNKYMEYGGRRVVFTPDEVKSVTRLGLPSEEMGLRILGFRPLSSLKWSHFVRSGSFIYPEEDEVAGSKRILSSLLIKCLEKKVMAICFYKPRHNWGPSYVALIPQEETREDGVQEAPPGFHLAYLPFSDDLRSVPTRPDANKERVQPEQLEAAKKVISKLRLKTYNPEAFPNPALQAHLCLIESLALNRDDVGDITDATLPPDDVMGDKLGVLSQEFHESVYPEDYEPEAKKKAEPKKKPLGEVLSMDAHIRGKSVEKLTVDVLKAFLSEKGVPISGKKKADLVRAVYEYHTQN